MKKFIKISVQTIAYLWLAVFFVRSIIGYTNLLLNCNNLIININEVVIRMTITIISFLFATVAYICIILKKPINNIMKNNITKRVMQTIAYLWLLSYHIWYLTDNIEWIISRDFFYVDIIIIYLMLPIISLLIITVTYILLIRKKPKIINNEIAELQE